MIITDVYDARLYMQVKLCLDDIVRRCKCKCYALCVCVCLFDWQFLLKERGCTLYLFHITFLENSLIFKGQ